MRIKKKHGLLNAIFYFNNKKNMSIRFVILILRVDFISYIQSSQNNNIKQNKLNEYIYIYLFTYLYLLL